MVILIFAGSFYAVVGAPLEPKLCVVDSILLPGGVKQRVVVSNEAGSERSAPVGHKF